MFLAGSAHADYLYDWAQVQTIADNAADGSNVQGGNDITEIQHAYANGTHYFRIDLTDSLSTDTNYGIYIDSREGGGTTAPATGIDYYLLSDYLKVSWDATESRWKVNETFSSTNGQGIYFQFSEDNGRTLEWSISPTDEVWDFGTSFNWLAATTSDKGILYDTTQQVASTPIPGAAWLLCSGLFGLAGLHRRSKKTG